MKTNALYTPHYLQ